jgi:hypothetical protein
VVPNFIRFVNIQVAEFLPLMSRYGIDIYVQVLCGARLSFLQDKYPGNTGSYVKYIVDSVRSCPAVVQSGCITLHPCHLRYEFYCRMSSP